MQYEGCVERENHDYWCADAQEARERERVTERLSTSVYVLDNSIYFRFFSTGEGTDATD